MGQGSWGVLGIMGCVVNLLECQLNQSKVTTKQRRHTYGESREQGERGRRASQVGGEERRCRGKGSRTCEALAWLQAPTSCLVFCTSPDFLCGSENRLVSNRHEEAESEPPPPPPHPRLPRLTPSIKVRELEVLQSVDRSAETPVDTQSFLQLPLNVFCGQFGFLAVFCLWPTPQTTVLSKQTTLF